MQNLHNNNGWRFEKALVSACLGFTTRGPFVVLKWLAAASRLYRSFHPTWRDLATGEPNGPIALGTHGNLLRADGVVWNFRRWHGPAIVLALERSPEDSAVTNAFLSFQGDEMDLEHVRPASTLEELSAGAWDEAIKELTASGATTLAEFEQEAPMRRPSRRMWTNL